MTSDFGIKHATIRGGEEGIPMEAAPMKVGGRLDRLEERTAEGFEAAHARIQDLERRLEHIELVISG